MKLGLDSCSYNYRSPQGVGALVRRSIGSASLRNLTPFLMLDHFHVSKGAVSSEPSISISSILI
jgi:quercetin 2,3-dioxygenase